MSNYINTTFEDSGKSGRITLYANPFGNGAEYYGRFERNTVSSHTLIARIQKHKAGTNELAVQQIAGFIKEEILEALRAGEAVNVLDLGILYLTPNGKFNGTTIDSGNKPPLSVRFTPSQLVQTAASEVGIKEITIATNAPLITGIVDQFTGKTDGSISAGKTVLLTGSRLKVRGEGSGIFLCPLDERQQPTADETQWLPCPIITRSTEKSVEFYVNDAAETETTYRILLRSYYSGGKDDRKSAKETVSDVVTIV